MFVSGTGGSAYALVVTYTDPVLLEAMLCDRCGCGVGESRGSLMLAVLCEGPVSVLQMAVKLTVSLSIREGLFTYFTASSGLEFVRFICLYLSQKSSCCEIRSLMSLSCSDPFNAALVYQAISEVHFTNEQMTDTYLCSAFILA